MLAQTFPLMDNDIDKFMADWGDPFRKVHAGLNLISDFSPDQLGKYHPGKALSIEERMARQAEWMRYLSGTEGKERLFYQPWWVPVQEEMFEWYIDISNPDFPVFAPYFCEAEPMQWFRNPISQSLSSLILLFEGGLGKNQLVELQTSGQLEIYWRETGIHDEKVFNGHLPTPPVTKEEVFVQGILSKPITDPDMSSFLLLNALPLSIGIFPPDTHISLNTIRYDLEDDLSAEFANISMIRHLMLLLRKYGQEYFPVFQFDLVNTEVSVWHNDLNELIVVGINSSEQQNLLKRMSKIAD